uniref:Uncharacterized protein n=1 Tax=Rhizophora mucronata TaxID=61149 RepID=A0A2P2N2H6_RHIMU
MKHEIYPDLIPLLTRLYNVMISYQLPCHCKRKPADCSNAERII